MSIEEFDGEYRFLSNFYPAPITYEGQEFPSVEHAYQAAKTFNPMHRDMVATAKYAGIAKKLGRHIDLRPDWDQVKLTIMERLLRKKFEHAHLREMLLATGDEELIEGNYWKDTFWGVCNGEGENHLGKLLMKIRDEIRTGTQVA